MRGSVNRDSRSLTSPTSPTAIAPRSDASVAPPGAVDLALDLERRGFRQGLDAAGRYFVEPAGGLSEGDRARLARWRPYLAAIISKQEVLA